jgi:hypothetical protein
MNITSIQIVNGGNGSYKDKSMLDNKSAISKDINVPSLILARQTRYPNVCDDGVDNMLKKDLKEGSPPPILKSQLVSRNNVIPKVGKILARVCGDGVGDNHTTPRKMIEGLLICFWSRRNCKKLSLKDHNRLVISLQNTFKSLVALYDDFDTQFKYLKYNLSIYVSKLACKGRDLVLPVAPDGYTPIITGFFHSHLQRMVARRDISYIMSIYQSKLIWPKIQDGSVVKSYEKHKLLFTTSRPPLPKDLKMMIKQTSIEIFGVEWSTKVDNNDNGGGILVPGQDIEVIELELDRANSEAKRPRKLQPQYNHSPAMKFFPTGSTCLQSGYSDGGNYSLYTKFDPTLEVDCQSKDGLHREDISSLSSQYEDWRKDNLDSCTQNAKRRMVEEPEVIRSLRVTHVYEPGKLRPLTIGDGYLYGALQPAQGQLISSWKKSQFQTMTVECDVRIANINKHSLKIEAQFPDVEFEWVSGDYESATDFLSMESTQLSLKPLPFLHNHKLAMDSVKPAQIYYPRFDKNYQEESCSRNLESYEKHVQLGGQPMGHPLSFPLLCSINLACYRMAIMRWMKEQSEVGKISKKAIRQIGIFLWNNVVINGDDIAYRAPKSFFEVWKRSTTEAGLKPSLGKCYQTNEFVMINSQIFVPYLKKGCRTMIRREYLNLRLMTGFSVKNESSYTPDEVSSKVNEMLNCIPWGASAINYIMLGNNIKTKKHIKRFVPNWFIPVHLGGFGIAPIHGTDIKISSQQRKVARLFIDEPKYSLFRTTHKTLSECSQVKVLKKKNVSGLRLIPEAEAEDWMFEKNKHSLSSLLLQADRAHVLENEHDANPQTFFRDVLRKAEKWGKPLSDSGFRKYWWSSVNEPYGQIAPAIKPFRSHPTHKFFTRKDENGILTGERHLYLGLQAKHPNHTQLL